MKDVQSLFSDSWNIPSHKTIIIGLSGGPDSAFLLHWLAFWRSHCSLNLIAAHLDHQWRSNSADDVIFCQTLCASYNIPFIACTASELPPFPDKGSQEALGRIMRRYFLQEIAKRYNADHIALGHHANDQQETFFIRLLRGSSLTGLTGMKEHEGLYWRPLLPVSKQAIIEYLDHHRIPYLVDPTNASDVYLRNRIRKTVIPALQESDRRFEANFAKTLEHLQDTEQFIQALTLQGLQECLNNPPSTHALQVKALQAQHPFLQKRILLAWLISNKLPFSPSTALLQEIERFIGNTKGTRHLLYNRWVLVKTSHTLSVEQIGS